MHAVVAAFLFHRHDLVADTHRDMQMLPGTGLRLQMLLGGMSALCTPAGALLRRKEILVLLAVLFTALGLLVLLDNPTHSGLYGAASMLGAAFGVTNAYSTKLWGYFYGEADVHRIRYTSIAITTAASGMLVWAFAMSRQVSRRATPTAPSTPLCAPLRAPLDPLHPCARPPRQAPTRTPSPTRARAPTR